MTQERVPQISPAFATKVLRAWGDEDAVIEIALAHGREFPVLGDEEQFTHRLRGLLAAKKSPETFLYDFMELIQQAPFEATS